MLSERLSGLLRDKGRLLADGATGTNLFAVGLLSGEAPERWLLDHPERVRALHRSFIEAGSDLILTNSFGATRQRLALHGLERRVRELNRIAAALACEEAEASGRTIIVAGSIGPTGELFAPLGALTHEVAVESFAEQAEGLKEGGADIAWIETMSAAEEIRAAAEGAALAGLPIAFTASFDTVGRTMMGLTPEGLADLAGEVGPVAAGANCGIGPADLVASILAMTERSPGLVVAAKGNCGIPVLDGDAVRYGGTPELMADYARLAAAAGARIIGGCCGTTPAHIRAMRRALDDFAETERPTLELVEARLGPIARPKGEERAERRSRRRDR